MYMYVCEDAHLVALRIGSHQNIVTISDDDDDDDDDLLNRLVELEIGSKVEPQMVRCEEPARMCVYYVIVR